MELLHHEILHTPVHGQVSKPTPYGGVSANGGLEVLLRGRIRCQICQSEKTFNSYSLTVFAVKKSVLHEIEKNLSWLADRLCKIDLVCDGCGFSSRCRKVDQEHVLDMLRQTLTESWFYSRFEEAGIPLGTKINEYT